MQTTVPSSKEQLRNGVKPWNVQKLCPRCNAGPFNAFQYTKHNKEAHPELAQKRQADPSEQTPLERIRAAERVLMSAVKDLEAERDQLHQRIIEIDNRIAKYRKFEGTGD